MTIRIYQSPLRLIVSHEEVRHKCTPTENGGSYVFKLECGHTVIAKKFFGIPKRKKCWECAMLKHNAQ